MLWSLTLSSWPAPNTKQELNPTLLNGNAYVMKLTCVLVQSWLRKKKHKKHKKNKRPPWSGCTSTSMWDGVLEKSNCDSSLVVDTLATKAFQESGVLTASSLHWIFIVWMAYWCFPFLDKLQFPSTIKTILLAVYLQILYRSL